MNKTLRYLFVTVFTIVSSLSFAGSTITFDATVDKGTQSGSSTGTDEVSKDGIKISVAPTGSFGNGYQYRTYKDATITITSTIGNITKVEFTCTANGTTKYGPGCFTGDGYTFDQNGNVGTWTGNAASLSLTASSAQVRATKIVVTVGEGGGTVEPQPTLEAKSIAEFKAQAQNKEVKLNLSDAKVVYCWTSDKGNTSVYVRDASGAIVFDCRNDYAAVGQNFATGNDIKGSIVLKNTLYNGLPQASATANTNVDDLTITAGSAAVPVECTVANAKDYLCDLVKISGVNVISDGAENPKFYATNGTDQVQVYNGFHLTAFDELSTFVGENMTVTGVMAVYKTTYEIYPIEEGITATGINNPTINVLDENAPIYNLAGQRVSKDTKGILIQNGRKFINNK